MMTEPKPLASLTAGLLARKGEARPASRAYVGFSSVASAAAAAEEGISPVADQQALLAEAFEEVSRTPIAPRAPRAPAGAKGKSAFTLRLDNERHLKLRLVGARTHRSAQALVTEALDRMLEEMLADDSCVCGRAGERR